MGGYANVVVWGDTRRGAHAAKQLGEFNYSARGESRRMRQERGVCVRRTHTKNR